MKKVIVSLVVSLLASSAFATSIDRTQVLAVASGYYQSVESVALLADGRMQIKKQDGKAKTIVLSEAAFQKISGELSHLANAEVKTDVRQFICMNVMRVMPTTLDILKVAKYDYQTNEFSGVPSLVLDADGCYMREHTAPVEEYALLLAQSVREELVILGMNAL